MEHAKSPYKIAVWATGAIGKYAIRAIARDAACQKGRSSLHGSGIHPGFCGDRLVQAPPGLRTALDLPMIVGYNVLNL